jgi:hypothetical protein
VALLVPSPASDTTPQYRDAQALHRGGKELALSTICSTASILALAKKLGGTRGKRILKGEVSSGSDIKVEHVALSTSRIGTGRRE